MTSHAAEQSATLPKVKAKWVSQMYVCGYDSYLLVSSSSR